AVVGPALVGALRDRDARTRYLAAHAVRRLLQAKHPVANAVAPLAALLADEDPDTAEHAARALELAGEQRVDLASAIDALAVAAESHPRECVRPRSRAALGEAADASAAHPRAVAAAIANLTGPDTAAWALQMFVKAGLDLAPHLENVRSALEDPRTAPAAVKT